LRALWFAFALTAALAAACSRQEAGWQEAERAGTAAAYEAYLAEYPAGPHAALARARIDALREDQDWARAERLRTPEAWQRYLSEWPEGRHAAEAKALLADFVPGVAAAGSGWWAQLGAWSGEARASAERQKLGDLHGAELGDVALSVLAPVMPEADVWRLRAGPLAEAEARALCARLRPRGVDCVPVPERSAGQLPP
jgi:hypothetical protein